MVIPLLGLGTWKLNGKECEFAVRQALEIGYRHIDTADAYHNHKDIRKGIKDWPRKDLFITTKLSIHDLIPKRVEGAAARFLSELGIDCLDLLLIHWPLPEVNLAETLQAMVELQNKGVTRFIGVSNFVKFHLEALAPYQFPILTNQIELHPFFQRTSLASLCRGMGIEITAYRPLAKNLCETHPVLQNIGKKHGKSATQVALRWFIENNYSVIPKASSFKHLRENFDIFDFRLTKEDLNEIRGLDSGTRLCAPNGLPIYED